MVNPETNSTTTASEPLCVGSADPNGVGQAGAKNSAGDEIDDQVPLRGVLAIDVAGEVIARFSGTLILNELPERQPEIIFDAGRRFRNDDDE